MFIMNDMENQLKSKLNIYISLISLRKNILSTYLWILFYNYNNLIILNFYFENL